MGNGLSKGDIDYSPLPYAHLKFTIHLPGTLFLTDATASTFLFIYVASFLTHSDLEIAYRARDLLYLTIGQKCYERMLPYFGHLGGENALRAIQSGKCSVKLSHVTANGRLLLHQIHSMLAIGDVQRSLYAGDATANN